jgi:hypothetical protein
MPLDLAAAILGWATNEIGRTGKRGLRRLVVGE